MTTALALSALLRRRGYKPLDVQQARQWGGITVHRNGTIGGQVRVVAHEGWDHEVDVPGTAKMIAEELAALGYRTDRYSAESGIVYVSGSPKQAKSSGPADAELLEQAIQLNLDLEAVAGSTNLTPLGEVMDSASSLGRRAYQEWKRFSKLASQAHAVAMEHWGTPRGKRALERHAAHQAMADSFWDIQREAFSIHSYTSGVFNALVDERFGGEQE